MSLNKVEARQFEKLKRPVTLMPTMFAKRIFKTIKKKEEEAFRQVIFFIITDLQCNGKSSFYSHLINMS